MGRKLFRVPLDFDYPIGESWVGYTLYPHNAEIIKKKSDKWLDYITDMIPNIDPPEGNGYQMWTTTVKPAPISPVFDNQEDLATWLETNATKFGEEKITKDEWLKFINLQNKGKIETALNLHVMDDTPIKPEFRTSLSSSKIDIYVHDNALFQLEDKEKDDSE